jgi:uncharacterized membrane protein YwaF
MIPFHGAWLVFLFIMAALGWGGHMALRGREARIQKTALAIAAGCNVAFSTTFTFNLILDPDVYFPLSQNLPFHFCTLMTVLAIPAVWFDWRPLRTVVYFPGVLGGFLALCSPAAIYQGQPVLSLMTFFYAAHALNVVIPILLGSLGLYRPRPRDAALAFPYFLVLAAGVFLLTLAFRAWLDPKANYFYFFDPEGAGILVALHDLIHIPVLYELPAITLATGVFYGQYGLHRLGGVVARGVGWRVRPRATSAAAA